MLFCHRSKYFYLSILSQKRFKLFYNYSFITKIDILHTYTVYIATIKYDIIVLSGKSIRKNNAQFNHCSKFPFLQSHSHISQYISVE